MKTRFAILFGALFCVMAACSSGEKTPSGNRSGDGGADASEPDAGKPDAFVRDAGSQPDIAISDRTDAGTDGPAAGDEVQPAGGKALIVQMATNPPSIAVMTLLETGGIQDLGIRIEGGIAARAVAIRKDCREAVVPYAGGSVGTEKGVIVVKIEPDGSAAEAVQKLVLGTNFSPTDAMYASDDEIVIGMRGPGDDNLQVLARNADGAWEIGPSVPSGEGPLELHPLPDDGTALLLRTDFLNNDSELLPIGRNEQGGWEKKAEGVPFDLMPIEMAVHPQGRLAYVPNDDPESSEMLNPPGVILVLKASMPGPAWELSSVLNLPVHGSQIAISREGTRAVINDPVGEMDELGRIFVRKYQLITIAIDDQGVPSMLGPPHTQLEVAMFDDFAFTPFDHLLAAVTLDGTTPLGQGETLHRLLLFEEEGSGRWKQIGSPLHLPAMASAMGICP